jgi:bifunctional DNase/RNase
LSDKLSGSNLKAQKPLILSVKNKKSKENSKEIQFHSLNAKFDHELLRFIPFGLQLSADGMNPVLLLRDEKGELTLPVLLNQLEAGVALTQSNKTIAPVSPHRVTELLLQGLNLQVESCQFIEVKGSHLYVRLNILGHQDLKFFKIRADEAMSFCLHLNVPIFATRDFVNQAKVLNAQTEGVIEGIKNNPEVLMRHHKYMM